MKTAIETGFDSLDKRLHGLTSPSLIVVASRPSMGKTSFALSVVEHVAIKQNIVCAVFSLEASTEQIVRKLLCSRAQVKHKSFREGHLKKQDWMKLKSAAETISNAPIYVDDSPVLTVLEIKAKIMRLQRECKLGLVVIDYLQLIRVDNKCKSRKAELSEISKSLRDLVKKIRVPVMLLSQLGRRPEYRNDKRPRLSDLHDLGSLGRDADTVLFVYRNWLYHFDSKDENKMEIIVGKHKNGGTGRVTLAFQDDITRLDNWVNDDID